MVKKLITLVLALLMVVTLLAACSNGKAPEEPDKPGTSAPAPAGTDKPDEPSGEKRELDIIWVHSGASNQSEQRAYSGFMAYLDEQEWKWSVTEVNSDDSGAKAANNISDAVAKGCDAIICSMVDMRASAAALQEANDAGIPVFTIDSGYTNGVVVDVTCNNNVMSAKISTYLIDALGGSGDICVLSAAGWAGGRKRGNILNAILEESPGINVLDDHNIDLADFYNDSAKTAEDWVSRFGDKIDAIWCVWDEPAMAVNQVLAANGYGREDVIVTGIDGNEAAVQLIRDGTPIVATVAQPFETMGSTVAKLIDKTVVRGMGWDEAVGATTLYVDAPLITPTNVPPEGTPAYQATDFYSID